MKNEVFNSKHILLTCNYQNVLGLDRSFSDTDNSTRVQLQYITTSSVLL